MQIETKNSMVIIKTIYLGHQNDLGNQKNLSPQNFNEKYLALLGDTIYSALTKTATKKPSSQIVTPVPPNSGGQILQIVYQISENNNCNSEV